MGVMKCHEATQFGTNAHFRGFFFPMEESDQDFYFTKELKLFLAYTVVIFIKNGLTFSSVFPIFNFQEWTLFGCGI